MARPKHCDTNIILRTTTALRDEYKHYCINNGTTLSKEINKYMEDTLKKRAIVDCAIGSNYTIAHIELNNMIQCITVTDKHNLLHGVTLPITLYDRFNAMTQGTINGDEVKAVLKELKQYMVHDSKDKQGMDYKDNTQ